MTRGAYANLSCFSLVQHDTSRFDIKRDKNFVNVFDQERKVGFIKTEYDSEIKTLYVQDMDVAHDYRGSGFSQLLLKEALLMFKEAEQIESLLVGSNQDVFVSEKNELVSGRRDRRPTDQDNFQAVLRTPAYKIRKSLGFSKVVEYEQASNHIFLSVRRDDLETEVGDQ